MFKTTLKARLLAAATLTGAMMGGTAAWAQEAAPVSTVDEVIVTAQLREQKTIDVPFALTAYSGQFLEDLGIQEFDQLSAWKTVRENVMFPLLASRRANRQEARERRQDHP